jgi:hypothetical protein
MNTVKSFVKQFAAILVGDNSTAKAEKALRQADSALKTQIASLKGDTISFEDAVTDAKESQAKARVNNGNEISNRAAYVQNLLEAKNRVTQAEEALETHLAKITFLEGELTLLNEEVEA